MSGALRRPEFLSPRLALVGYEGSLGSTAWRCYYAMRHRAYRAIEQYPPALTWIGYFGWGTSGPAISMMFSNAVGLLVVIFTLPCSGPDFRGVTNARSVTRSRGCTWIGVVCSNRTSAFPSTNSGTNNVNDESLRLIRWSTTGDYFPMIGFITPKKS